ncbi:MAG: HAD family hydrolase [Candidatus Omnitrophica bacterium]|nr:HAD family hydrolase [Candidatus Omnitrophota bacterium]
MNLIQNRAFLSKARVVFLDRDGVINEYPGDFQYVTEWKAFRFLPNVFEALRRLSENAFKLFIISNQAGVSKGIYSYEALKSITENMLEELSKQGVIISGVYYCIHQPEDNCNCRKPKTGLIDRAIERLKSENLDIDLQHSYFVGDTIRDVETGIAAGLNTILVFSGKEKLENRHNWQVQPDFTASNLSEAVDLILK